MHVFQSILRQKSKPDPINLSNIRVASPCPSDWGKMVGTEQVRHCSECNLNVYNLSAMNERQVQELIADSRGKAAVHALLSARRRHDSYSGLPVESACADPESLASDCSRAGSAHGRNCSDGKKQATACHLRMQPKPAERFRDQNHRRGPARRSHPQS